MIKNIVGLASWFVLSSYAIGAEVALPKMSEMRLGWRLHCVGDRSAVFLQWAQDPGFSSPGGFTLANGKTWAVAGFDKKVVLQRVGFRAGTDGKLVASSGAVSVSLTFDGELMRDLICESMGDVWLTTTAAGETVSERAHCSVEITSMMDLKCHSQD
jgi:hypothetical protein